MHAVENPWNGMYIEIRKDTTRQRKGSLGIVHAVVSDGFEIQVVEVVLVTTRGMPFNELSTLRKRRISTNALHPCHLSRRPSAVNSRKATVPEGPKSEGVIANSPAGTVKGGLAWEALQSSKTGVVITSHRQPRMIVAERWASSVQMFSDHHCKIVPLGGPTPVTDDLIAELGRRQLPGLGVGEGLFKEVEHSGIGQFLRPKWGTNHLVSHSPTSPPHTARILQRLVVRDGTVQG